MLTVHFICTGNSYRSRLAEACFNARAIPELRASSSGIFAHLNENGPITWYAARLIKRNGLVPFMSHTWTQTDAELLRGADYVIFLAKEHHHYCCEHFDFRDTPHEVWDVADVERSSLPSGISPDEAELLIMRQTERTFEQISRLVDELIARLTYSPAHSADEAAGNRQ